MVISIFMLECGSVEIRVLDVFHLLFNLDAYTLIGVKFLYNFKI